MEVLVIPNIYGLISSDSASGQKILLQERWKPESDPANSGKLELPGGKWRAWESSADCLRREVAEETGLNVIFDQSHASEMTQGEDVVEVIVPVTVVQMTKGPYPSMIVLLRGTAVGTPLSLGDGSRNASWHDVNEVRRLVEQSPGRFTTLTLAMLKTTI